MNKTLDEKALELRFNAWYRDTYSDSDIDDFNLEAMQAAWFAAHFEATQEGESEAVVSGDAQDIADRLRQIKDPGTTRFLALDAALMIEYLNKKRTNIAALQADNERLREATQAIIDWCDLALKNAAEFDSHGVRNLDGPIFNAARVALAGQEKQG